MGWLETGTMPDVLRSKNIIASLLEDEWLGPITSKEELLQPLRAIHASLVECGDGIVANGQVADVISR